MAVNEPIEVTVVGGGIAGITSALRLAQRGYSVTLFEQKSELGGNLSAVYAGHGPIETPDGIIEGTPLWHDVYPHMFSTFYYNFWHIVEQDLGWRDREAHFQRRYGAKVLLPDGTYIDMTDGTFFLNWWKNLWSGLLPPADLIVWGYQMLDLMSDPLHGRTLADTVTVNSFMESKPYSTRRANELHEFILMVIWSAHSYWVPASAYRDFYAFTYRDPTPWSWILRGDLYHHLIEPLEETLGELRLEDGRKAVTIRKCCKITQVVVEDGRVSQIRVAEVAEEDCREGSGPWWIPPPDGTLVDVENLILAVDPQECGLLAQGGDEGEGNRLTEYIPTLSETRRAKSDPIAVLNLYFKVKLPDIPKEHVSLWDSPFNLSFVDISQVWPHLEKEGKTVLVVAASNSYGLPTQGDEAWGAWIDAMTMGEGLKTALPQIHIDLVDLEKSYFHTLDSHHLFINSPGSETWRPATFNPAVRNLFLAGGFVENRVGMATVEAAVITGLEAAKALHEQHSAERPIEIIGHEAYPVPWINAMKLATMPWAYQAKWWSAMSDVANDVVHGEPPARWGNEVAAMWALPGHMALDFWRTSAALFLSPWE